MTKRWLACAFVAVGAIGFLAGVGFSEDEPPSDEEMMKMMLELGQPGPQHEIFKSMAGEWTASAKFWMKPGEEPQLTSGSATNTLVLGGRFLHQRFNGMFQGMKHFGSGFLGHDNFKKTYQNLWVDNFSSGMALSEGTGGEDGKSINLSYTWEGPMGKIPGRFTYTVTGKDSHKLEGWMTMGEQEMKSMEIVYTREKRGGRDCQPRRRRR